MYFKVLEVIELKLSTQKQTVFLKYHEQKKLPGEKHSWVCHTHYTIGTDLKFMKLAEWKDRRGIIIHLGVHETELRIMVYRLYCMQRFKHTVHSSIAMHVRCAVHKQTKLYAMQHLQHMFIAI